MAQREPTLRIQEIDPAMVEAGAIPYAMPHDRAWWFLDYGEGGVNLNMRWCIVARRDHEDMQLVTPFGSTYERALDLIVKEVALAKEAIAEIRRQASAPRIAEALGRDGE